MEFARASSVEARARLGNYINRLLPPTPPPPTPPPKDPFPRADFEDMDKLRPESSVAGEKRQRAIQDAKEMSQQVVRNCERTNTTVPPYAFVELIGKGAFGRVYKCREQSTGELVAIKIVDTDEVDYHQDSLDKDDTIRDFRKEVTILQQLKDSNAKNVNMIHDAFDLQQQLWIVSDYCTGGSVRTLMRAQPTTHPGLQERFVVPIARELALAMKSVHDIGVIHRDIKCTNVYITEEGKIQLGDFGIVGVLDDGVSKRQTMIGTPHYMPREMLIHGTGNQVAEAYGTEVDIWSYGCTVFEMATGQPPNAVKRQDTLMKELLVAPRLEGEQYSQELRDFVAFCLKSNPAKRPTAEQVLRHPYIADTDQKYPTRNLVELIHRFKMWEYGGGVRQSLFMAGGAPSVSGEKSGDTTSDEDDLDEWNFSTSDSFHEAYEKRFSQMVQEGSSSGGQLGTKLSLDTNLTPLQKLQQQHKEVLATRGERSLERIFAEDGPSYELHTPVEVPSPTDDYDLPLRGFNAGAPTRESHVMAPVRDSQIIIDLDTGGHNDIPSDNFDFGDGPTLKAKSFHSQHEDDDDDGYRQEDFEADRQKRATMEWKFPTARPAAQRATMEWKFPSAAATESEDNEIAEVSTPSAPIQNSMSSRPMLRHMATEPIGPSRDHVPRFQQNPPPSLARESLIDLDLGDPAEIARPSTARSTTSSAAGSTMTDATSGNPFDLEDDDTQIEADRNRFSYHKQWQSEGGQIAPSSRRSIPMHARGSSLSSTASELERPSTADSEDVFSLDHAHNNNYTERPHAQANALYPSNSLNLEQWPSFNTDPSYDRVRDYTDSLQDLGQMQRDMHASVNGSAASSRRPSLAQLEIELPALEAPHPDALREDADPRLMEAELSRLLENLGQTLDITVGALQRYAGIDDEDAGNEAGIGETTGDEE